MKTATIRGVPHAMQKDGWWMEGFKRRPTEKPGSGRSDLRAPLMLIALMVLGDALVWLVLPGLSLAVFALCLIGAALLSAKSATRAIIQQVSAIGTLSVLPVIELLQPLSAAILCAGLLSCLCLISGAHKSELLRAHLRYPWVALCTTFRDLKTAISRAGDLRPRNTQLRDVVIGWTVPLALGALFLTLLTGANPVLNEFLQGLGRLDLNIDVNGLRLWFWLILGFVIWSSLVAHRLRGPLTARRPERITVKRPGLINADSVTRSLVLFNAMFGVQTGMDLFFLYGATGLPDGMSYAEYAHRGAYPLLLTALLAGAFALLAQPLTRRAPRLRWLLLIWLAQTMALVVASLTRLEIYVDVYGLTRLRMAAAIWMVLVACGIGLMFWQSLRGLTAGWMLLRSGALGLVTLFACAFVNFDATIVRYNLTHDVPRDAGYLCSLSESAVPTMRRYGFDDFHQCAGNYWGTPRVSVPADWREWGFRNWRLRRSLARMTAQEAGF